jgi:sugar/nucleoside kinase (ribokinase family)
MTVPVPGFPLPYRPTYHPDRLDVGVGGVGAHVAHVLRALGDDVTLCGVVGDDPAGAAIRCELDRRGLGGETIVTGPGSSLLMVLVAPDGRRVVWPYLAAVNAVTYPAELFTRAARDADLAVVTNTVFARALLPFAAALGVPVAVDVHLISDVNDPYDRPWLELADLVFCSGEALPCRPEDWVGRVFTRFPGCAIAAVGRGARGCVMGLRDGTLLTAGAVAPRGVVDTTGAGDALFASFLHGWLATGNPVGALRGAVGYAGWQVGSPTPDDAALSAEGLAALSGEWPVEITVGRWDRGRSPHGTAA